LREKLLACNLKRESVPELQAAYAAAIVSTWNFFTCNTKGAFGEAFNWKAGNKFPGAK